jgi:hypothetical protein
MRRRSFPRLASRWKRSSQSRDGNHLRVRVAKTPSGAKSLALPRLGEDCAVGEWLRIAVWSFVSVLRSRRDLVLENVALRQPLMVLRRRPGHVRLKDRDRPRIGIIKTLRAREGEERSGRGWGFGVGEGRRRVQRGRRGWAQARRDGTEGFDRGRPGRDPGGELYLAREEGS